MKTATRNASNRSIWFPKYEQISKADTLAAFAQRGWMIVEMAEKNQAIAIEPITLTAIKAVKEVGALCCYGNRSAQDVINELLPAVIALDDLLTAIHTDAARRAQRLFAEIVTESRLWQQRQKQSVLVAMGGRA